MKESEGRESEGHSKPGMIASPKMIGNSLRDIATPAAVISREKLKQNCARMRDHVHTLGSRLRPHMKTLKSVDAARVAVDPFHGGIAVATLNEARYFAERGFSDVCCAVCLPPDKFGAAARLAESGAQLSFFVDDAQVARAASGRGARFGLWIELDCGEHRTGVDPDSPALIEIANAVSSGGHAKLLGVATHAGHSYACRTFREIREVAEQERIAAVSAAERLRKAGFLVPNVSVGSTPTTINAVSANGITEFRAGVYMAGDLVQAALGSLELNEIAFSVLSTVISVRPDQHRIVLDAGGLALSKDRGTKGTACDYGYGLVLDLYSKRAFGDLTISEVHQEHGEVWNVPQAAIDQLQVGSKVRILPNHVCMTAAMYDELLVIHDDEGPVQEVWGRTNGWS